MIHYNTYCIVFYNNIQCIKIQYCIVLYNNIQVAGLALGAGSGVRNNITHKNFLKNIIKDGHNSTKIGPSNIFGGNQLTFQISAQ